MKCYTTPWMQTSDPGQSRIIQPQDTTKPLESVVIFFLLSSSPVFFKLPSLDIYSFQSLDKAPLDRQWNLSEGQIWTILDPWTEKSTVLTPDKNFNLFDKPYSHPHVRTKTGIAQFK